MRKSKIGKPGTNDLEKSGRLNNTVNRKEEYLVKLPKKRDLLKIKGIVLLSVPGKKKKLSSIMVER